MAAEETEFSVEATPVFDDVGGQTSSSPPRQGGGSAAGGGASRPQPNVIQPNVSGQSRPNHSGAGQSSSANPQDHFLLDNDGDNVSPSTSLPLGFDDGLFGDLHNEDAGFGPADDFSGLGSGASTKPALLIDKQSGMRHEIHALPFVIGRDRQCDLVLDDPQVAPQHAEIIDEFGRMVIRELEAHSDQDQPIEVNGFPVDQVMLDHGDAVRIGGYLFEFQPGQGVTNKPADELVQRSTVDGKRAGNTSFMARVRRQWMFLVPLAVLGYAGYVLVDTYLFEPEPTLVPPKAANRGLNPASQMPFDGAIQSENGGIHFTLGDGAPAEGNQFPATQPNRAAAPGATQPVNPSVKPGAPTPSPNFDYEKIFNAGGQNPNQQAGGANQAPETAARQQANRQAAPNVAPPNVAPATSASQWPRFSDDPPAANPNQASTTQPTAARPPAVRPSHLAGAGDAFPSFPNEQAGTAEAAWPEDEGVLEGDLLEGELIESGLVAEPKSKQPTFEEQVGTAPASRPSFGQDGWPTDRTQDSPKTSSSRNDDRMRVDVDVPARSKPTAQPDWMSQEDPYDQAGNDIARGSRRGASSAAAEGPEDVFDSAAEAANFDANNFQNKQKAASEDPFMDMIEERLATLEREQREKVEAVRGAKQKQAVEEASSTATVAESTPDLAMLAPPRADDGQPLNAGEMPMPPSEAMPFDDNMPAADSEFRPGPGMPLPTDRLDKSQGASAFVQPGQLSAEAAEAAARDLVLQSELIYKEDGAKQLLDDLKRLSEHPDVSVRLKRELADQYARIAELYRLYTEGQKDFALGSKEDAFEHWIAFLSSEKVVIPTGTSRYAAEVRNIVAQEYVGRATDAERSQDWPQAWRYWNAAKKFGKTAMANRKMRDIEERAQQLFDQGIDLEATDPVSARNLWQRTMRMLPEQHALYGQAAAKVAWYEQWRY